MSKLATLFSAGVFFGLAMFSSSATPDTDAMSIIDHVNFVYGCISDRLQILSDLIPAAISLPTNEKNSGLVKQLKQDMTTNADWTRLMVHRALNDPNNNNTYDQTMCTSYLLEYEREVESIERKLTRHMSSALNETITQLLDALEVCNVAANKIQNLKHKAQSCFQRKCYDIRTSADNILRDVFDKTSTVTCADDHLANRMQMLVRMENDSLIKKGLDVIKNTTLCTLA